VVANPDEAAAIAQAVGYPVMIKAVAGGGGRGMRVVTASDEMAAAFARCQSEAQAAFGDGSLFVEKQLGRPRHIEVQILADIHRNVIHLYERDCSVQLRNQKILEIAPAPGIAPDLRQRILDDAVRLAREANFVNAGTVEFLVVPESGEHFFLECNPRIQVEHTITEQLMRLDLVEAQFRIAAGETLKALGLPEQEEIEPPRGYVIQARIVATGGGTLTSYKEPTGPGVRVDSCGYLGYTPPPQFDPMFAKVICESSSTHSFASAIDRALRALDEFHIAGLPTNLPQLKRILSHPMLRAGDARTTFLAEHPNLLSPPGELIRTPASLTLLEQQAAKVRGGKSMQGLSGPAPEAANLPVPNGQAGVASPITGTVVELTVEAGATVDAGATLMVVSAMKMESVIASPCAGVVTAIRPTELSAIVAAGQIVATIAPAEGADGLVTARQYGDDTWAPMLAEVRALSVIAHKRFESDSADPGVVRQRQRGKLTCRERIDLLLDPGSFREVGSVAGFTDYDSNGRVSGFTPANHVGGWGKMAKRLTVVCADDFTSRGGHADGAISAKAFYLDQLSLDLRCPSIRLLDGSSGGGSVAAMVPKQQKTGESSAQESSGTIIAGRPRVLGEGGSFLVPHLGSATYAAQLAQVPVVNVLLGSVVGIGAAKAVLGHFAVMVRDIAELFVAGPPVVSHAMGYDISKEELGGWQVHCRNGSVDNLAESEEEAAALTRRFLSYLPSSVYEAPPRLPPDPDDAFDRGEELFTIIPRKRTTTFDMRRAIRLMADRCSFFEIGPLWGTDQIVGFLRFNGYPMGVVASDCRHLNGGAMTADGCDKLIRHLDVCDLFHLPILNLIDSPGFAVGLEHEISGTIRKGAEWMIAYAQVSVPIFTVIMRRSFGVAGNNFATPRSGASARVVWPAADVGGIPPEGGIEAAYKRQLAEAADPAVLRAEINERIERARGPIGPLNKFQIEEMIDPRDTRRWICEWVENAYRIVSRPTFLVPRAIGFRP
jgi:acetyl/propionyl-CoA carboxylase alpha subunit/acetyl-CoA carboxylase carboxyltransferase component